MENSNLKRTFDFEPENVKHAVFSMKGQQITIPNIENPLLTDMLQCTIELQNGKLHEGLFDPSTFIHVISEYLSKFHHPIQP